MASAVLCNSKPQSFWPMITNEFLCSPYKFEAPWNDFEFAHHVLDSGATLVVIPMAWIANDGPQKFSRPPQEPDMDTLLYWVSRFEPIIRANSPEEVIIVFANRTGSEGDATYTGTSAVIGIQSGEVLVYGILGRGDKRLLIVDTESAPCAKLVLRPADYGTDPETPCMSDRDRNHESQLGFDSATTSLVGRITSEAGPERPPLTLSDSHFTRPGEENSSNSAEKEKRCSIRSDVSVWNNHQGRPSSHANQTTLTPERSLQQTDFETSGPRSFSTHPSGTNTCSLFPERLSLPKSRHASRSRGPGRSDSAARKRADLDTTCHRLESIAIRSDRARDQPVSVNALHHHSTSASGYQASRSRSASPPIKLDGRAISRGRHREGRSTTNQQAPRGSMSSQRGNHEAKTEPVDLSQSALVKQHPTPHCPVHSSRHCTCAGIELDTEAAHRE